MPCHADVSEAEPNSSVIYKYISESDQARRAGVRYPTSTQNNMYIVIRLSAYIIIKSSPLYVEFRTNATRLILNTT